MVFEKHSFMVGESTHLSCFCICRDGEEMALSNVCMLLYEYQDKLQEVKSVLGKYREYSRDNSSNQLLLKSIYRDLGLEW